MRIAITGGTGFVGGHVAKRLLQDGHDVVLIARGNRPTDFIVHPNTRATFVSSDLSEAGPLTRDFAGCEAVMHCAGINREIGAQTYQKVHIDATRNVIEAAQKAGVRKIVFMSFLRARPHCGSAYHESKWAAEEMIRSCGLDYSILKSGMVYGRGDHMLDHLSHAFFTFPVLATVGFRQKRIRPVAIEDLVDIAAAALVEGKLPRSTAPVVGAEELLLSEAARRVAKVLGRRILIFPAPVALHYLLARLYEWTMKVPLVARAQVRILAEGVVQASPPCPSLPADLTPKRPFTEQQILDGLPKRGPFGLRDLRCCMHEQTR